MYRLRRLPALRPSLYSRVGLVLTALAASLLLILGSLWLHGTRNAIHEEVEAASRVSEQWLAVMLRELAEQPAAVRGERLFGMVRALGRVRANELSIHDAEGAVRYRSPGSTYKAGRAAPDWFADLLAVNLPVRELSLDRYHLRLQPDPSRAVLDAWDELVGLAGWAVCLLGLLFVASRGALGRALRPLGQIMQALDQTGRGRFDTRLPVFATPELARLSRAFNGMADRLEAAVCDNVRLETEREVAACVQGRLDAERRLIAGELHDELAQGITAVRTLAGAIVQRSTGLPAVHGAAQGIVAVTGEMQDGVRHILQRLQPVIGEGLEAGLRKLVADWRGRHPAVAVDCRVQLGAAALEAELAGTVRRIVQEGLTNIARHAAPGRIELCVERDAAGLGIRLANDGCHHDPAAGGCGFGLAAMAERVAALGGRLAIDRPAADAFCLTVRLPVQADVLMEECS